MCMRLSQRQLLRAYISKFKGAKNIFNFSCLGVEKLLDVNKLWEDR
jgi:hypothetical protein